MEGPVQGPSEGHFRLYAIHLQRARAQQQTHQPVQELRMEGNLHIPTFQEAGSTAFGVHFSGRWPGDPLCTRQRGGVNEFRTGTGLDRSAECAAWKHALQDGYHQQEG
jgi:hypothetical protein